jgi:hypothetical protein
VERKATRTEHKLSTWTKTEIHGTIKSTRTLKLEEIQKLERDQIHFYYDQEELESMVEEDTLTPDESAKLGDEGEVDQLITDNSPDILEVTTDEGVFLIIAQNTDGHGHLLIVEQSQYDDAIGVPKDKS